MKRLLSTLLTMSMAAAMPHAIAQADALAKIKSDGIIKVGINPDYRPFGMRPTFPAAYASWRASCASRSCSIVFRVSCRADSSSEWPSRDRSRCGRT